MCEYVECPDKCASECKHSKPHWKNKDCKSDNDICPACIEASESARNDEACIVFVDAVKKLYSLGFVVGEAADGIPGIFGESILDKMGTRDRYLEGIKEDEKEKEKILKERG